MPPKETRISARITTETWCSHPGGWCLTHQSLQITGQLLKENHYDIIMCEYALVLSIYLQLPKASMLINQLPFEQVVLDEKRNKVTSLLSVAF